MIFEPLAVQGAWLIRQERRSDHRGHFARVWCEAELAKAGLDARIAQVNTGFSPKAGTLRGLHFQLPPHAEVKIARVTRGAAFDVVLDLRQGSPTYGRWAGVELTADNGDQVYVPEGCAHGYLTLVDDTELVYSATVPYAPASARGVRFDDPRFGIEWPMAPAVISDPDRGWPLHQPADAVILGAAR